MPITEAELVDLLTGITRVQLAIIRGLSLNHPRLAENIMRHLREEAALTEPDGMPTLNGLPTRLLLEMLAAKPLYAEEPDGPEIPRSFLQAVQKPKASVREGS